MKRNRALIAATAQGVTDYSDAAGPLIKQTSVTDPSLLPIYELVGSLPNLPDGYAHRDDSDPARPDVRPQPALAAGGRIGRPVPGQRSNG